MSIELLTFGCRLNSVESDVMRGHAEKAGLENVIIVNTCTVTKEAERQARQAIRKARRANPNAKLIVTGCAAQVNPESFAAMPEVDIVLDNTRKMEAAAFAEIRGEEQGATQIKQVEESAAQGQTNTSRTRAFVQVQNGCNHRCTFCIIPYGRGDSRSVPMGEVVNHVRSLVEQGYKEVVFTGVDISAYGEDLPATPTLGSLVRRTLRAVPELPRLRISSIDAVEMDDELWEAVANEDRLMPHLHLSLQAGDDMILKRMKRRHLRADILEFAEKARRLRPEIVLGADIIAGFPTETEAMFQNTLEVVAEAGLTWLHVFPYSARSGTPAAKMPQVPLTVRKERAARLRTEGQKQEQAFLASRVGKQAQVLVEQGGFGHTEHFARVRVSGDHAAGSLLTAEITNVQEKMLIC